MLKSVICLYIVKQFCHFHFPLLFARFLTTLTACASMVPSEIATLGQYLQKYELNECKVQKEGSVNHADQM